MARLGIPQTHTSNGTTATTAVLTRPVDLANGDRLIACVTLIRAAATITWNAGPTDWNTYISPIANNPTHTMMWYKDIVDVGSEPADYTFSWGGGGRVASFIAAIKDHNGSETPVVASANSNAADTSTIDTTVEDSLLVRIVTCDNAGSASFTTPEPYKQYLNFQSGTGAASAEMAVAYLYQHDVRNSGAIAWSMATTDQWNAITIAFKPATVPAPVDQIITNVPYTFSRQLPTVSPIGEVVAAHRMRFDKAQVFVPTTRWEKLMDVPGTDASFRYSGLDHDGYTPITVWYKSSSGTHYFYRGNTLVRTITLTDLMNGAYGSVTYGTRPGVFIHYGAIIFQCERKVSGVTVGIGICVTQDMGATFTRVEEVGGGDFPVIAASSGMQRTHRWSLCAAYPKTAGSEKTDVFVPWADYISRGSPDPEGGQVGVFRMTRSTPSGLWTLHANRTVHSEWTGFTGIHIHTAAVVDGGLVSHWGDVGDHNQVMYHQLDMDNYQTAPITSTVVFGGITGSDTVYQLAPQPVAAIPGPVHGTHFASGDESSPAVPYMWWDTDEDRFIVDTAGDILEPTKEGGTWGSAAFLNAYTLNGRYLVPPYYSPNGLYFGQIGDNIKFYGRSQILKPVTGDGIYVGPVPAALVIRPVRISGGTRNILDRFTVQTAPHADVTTRQVYWDASLESFHYTDDDSLLDPQPPAIDVFESTMLYEFETTNDRNVGSYLLSNLTWNTAKNKCFMAKVFNMSKIPDSSNHLGLGMSMTYKAGTTNHLDGESGWPTSDNQNWKNYYEIIDPDTRETTVVRWTAYLGPSSGIYYPETKILVALIGVSETDSASYPLEYTPVYQRHEQLKYTLASSAAWTWNGAFYYDTKGVVDATYGSNRVFATLYLNKLNTIKVSVQTTTSVRFTITKAGVTTTHDVTISEIVWGVVLEIFVTCDGTDLTLRVRTGFETEFNELVVDDAAISPVSLFIGDENFESVQDIGVFANYYWTEVKPLTVTHKRLDVRNGPNRTHFNFYQRSLG